MVKCGDDSGDFGVERPFAPNLVSIEVHPGNVEVALRVGIGRPPNGRVRDVDRIEPTNSAVSRTAKLAALVVITSGAPTLILEAVARAIRFINRKPLLISASRSGESGIIHSPTQRTPDIIEEVLQQTEVEELAVAIGIQNRIAPKDITLQNAGENPGGAAVRGVAITGLTEVRRDAVKLPPSHGHAVVISWINCQRRLVRGVADNIVAVAIDIHLDASEFTEV